MRKKEVKESSSKQQIIVVIGLIISILVGLMIGIVITKRGQSPVMSILYFIIFIITYIMQIVLHEVGHLIFGLCSGYKFLSFRIGKLTFLEENGKIVIKKFNVVGTGGQCLMMPPEGNGYDCPYVLYNLGGVFMNFIVMCLGIIGYEFFYKYHMLREFCFYSIFIGMVNVFINGIPIKSIRNDGYNLISIKKNKYERYSYYIVLKVNALLYKGVRIKDMPIKWFDIDNEEKLSGSMSNNVRALLGNYYHDKREFCKARSIFEELINNSSNLGKVLKNELICDILFYEIIGEQREEVINELYTNELKKYIKATECYISRKRLMYAYYIIIEKDKERANKVLKEVDNIKNTYPVKAEIESELEIIEFIKRKINVNNDIYI